MSFSSESCLVLLTYKGKILLKLFEDDPLILNDPYMVRTHVWEFIEGKKGSDESFLDAILKKVEKTTSIRLTNIDLLSTILSNREKRYLYYAKLTDEQVNNMVRQEGHLLQFFSFKEIESLSLSQATLLFISKHRDFMENIFTSSACSN